MRTNASLITRGVLLLLPLLVVGCASVGRSQALPLNSPQGITPTETSPGKPTSTPGPLPPVALPDTGQKLTLQIDINDDYFQPQDVTIPIGYTVSWVNLGSHPHTVTADGGSFSSQLLQPGSSFEHRFDKAGTYDYFCEVHGEAGRRGMYGTITVAAGSTPVAITVPQN